MPPGGDPAFLIFWFFFIKKKERTKESFTFYLYDLHLLYGLATIKWTFS